MAEQSNNALTFSQVLKAQKFSADDEEIIDSLLKGAKDRIEFEELLIQKPEFIRHLIDFYRRKRHAIENISKEEWEKIVEDELKMLEAVQED
ncbi:hypothetical protein A3B36_01810 [Candidatus Uhrbacteria bacterium RIFCSPLOWO2_01_FULL_55_36]|uniref:Uncharacterized protein n=2 Tax=Parcubacteria group TaxID=1794811 RepID=A0A0G1WE33_9BACT|nr:MAG: hypothetical protein UY58_C0016G0007 [Candidatus Magasanikbacteria bacterium GW2011_GWA2_50_22]OGL84240.1 MAG: hypothetical protein A3B36_01810 [Candidatus Uhrbacteria bacterium RIFCSPLOWO2_01_FULL_55_36]